jgi:hypothetical protein
MPSRKIIGLDVKSPIKQNLEDMIKHKDGSGKDNSQPTKIQMNNH